MRTEPLTAETLIYFVTTQAHQYTMDNLVRRQGPDRCESWSYEQLFESQKLPTGTWVFCDFERLSIQQITQSAKIARKLKKRGARVMNDPSLVRSRYEILRRLNATGINSFAAYRAEADPKPTSFPVFIRNANDHDSSQIELLHDQNALDTALKELEANSVSLIGKLVIEHAGEPASENLWMRMSTYRFGDSIISHHAGFDEQWIVKDGLEGEDFESHPKKDWMIAKETEFVQDELYSETLKQAFEIARIDYGRADFSIYQGRVQIYEINTNPTHGNLEEILQIINVDRKALLERVEDQLHEAISNEASKTGTAQKLAKAVGLKRKYVNIR